jgi:hypothetical protein
MAPNSASCGSDRRTAPKAAAPRTAITIGTRTSAAPATRSHTACIGVKPPLISALANAPELPKQTEETTASPRPHAFALPGTSRPFTRTLPMAFPGGVPGAEGLLMSVLV